MFLRYFILSIVLASVCNYSEEKWIHKERHGVEDLLESQYFLEAMQDRISLLMSIPSDQRTFENFFIPYCCLKEDVFVAATNTKQYVDFFSYVDPYERMLSEIKDLEIKLCKDQSTNTYQRLLLQKNFTSPDKDSFLHTFEDFNDPDTWQNRENVWNGQLTVLSGEVRFSDAASLEEDVQKIIESNPDVVCIHNTPNCEMKYKLYEALRKKYRYFCIEDGKASKEYTFIASNYCLNPEGSCFLDDSGIFSKIEINNLGKSIARIFVLRSSSALSSELFDANIQMRIPDMYQFSIDSIPTIMCENVKESIFISKQYEWFREEYLQKNFDDIGNISLLKTNQAFYTASQKDLGQDFFATIAHIILYPDCRNIQVYQCKQCEFSCNLDSDNSRKKRDPECDALDNKQCWNKDWHGSAGAHVDAGRDGQGNVNMSVGIDIRVDF